MFPAVFVRTWNRMRARKSNRTPRFCRLECERLEDRSVPSAMNGTWSAGPVAPGGIGTMMLLSDGTVMAQEGEYWSRLSPDAQGSYANGSWYAMPQSMMNTDRLYYGSALLPNGRLFLVGGEYSTLAGYQNLTNLSETYDPLTNTWGYNSPFPQNNFGDDPVEVLPNGNVLAGYVYGPQTYVYNPATNAWSNGPTKFYNDPSDEETWTLLPNGDVLSYDLFASISSGTFEGEIYNPNTNSWSPTTNSTTNPPSQLSSPGIGYEMGPGELLPDGRVFQIGANGNTAFYDYRTNTWSAGPQIIDSQGRLFGSDDAPAALLPSGQVVFAADAGPTSGLWQPPTELFEFDPTTNTISQIPSSSLPAGLQNDLSGESAYATRMMMLPSGQLALSDSSSQLWLFTLNTGGPGKPWRPTVTDVSYNSSMGQFTLTGARLTGLSEGSSYGDDVTNATNYPIVQLQAPGGQDYFAYTSGWTPSVSAAGDDTPQSIQFVLPDGVPAGTYLLTVTANGVSSNPFHVKVTAAEATALPQNLVVTGGSQFVNTYDYFYYDNYNYYYYPYNFAYSSSFANNGSDYSDWYYVNPYYANVYGATNAGQQLGYYGHTGVSTVANAYANPVYYGNFAYSQSEATDFITFSLATESLVTFDYDSGAYVATSGTSYAYANAFGEVYNNNTGYYYYVYDNASSYNGGGPYTFYGSGSFVIDLPAGNYTLYSDSYVYSYAYTYAAGLASAYNGVALANVTPVSGTAAFAASPESSGTLPPSLSAGLPPITGVPSGQGIGGTGFGTGTAEPDAASSHPALLGMAFQPQVQGVDATTLQPDQDVAFASLGAAGTIGPRRRHHHHHAENAASTRAVLNPEVSPQSHDSALTAGKVEKPPSRET